VLLPCNRVASTLCYKLCSKLLVSCARAVAAAAAAAVGTMLWLCVWMIETQQNNILESDLSLIALRVYSSIDRESCMTGGKQEACRWAEYGKQTAQSACRVSMPVDCVHKAAGRES
jgi:hypothetical protein